MHIRHCESIWSMSLLPFTGSSLVSDATYACLNQSLTPTCSFRTAINISPGKITDVVPAYQATLITSARIHPQAPVQLAIHRADFQISVHVDNYIPSHNVYGHWMNVIGSFTNTGWVAKKRLMQEIISCNPLLQRMRQTSLDSKVK